VNLQHSISQLFESNMGNRITPELAAGMIRGLVAILAAGVQVAATSQESPEQSIEHAKGEPWPGMT